MPKFNKTNWRQFNHGRCKRGLLGSQTKTPGEVRKEEIAERERESWREEEKPLRKRAKYLNNCKDKLWNRWKKEYLTALRERPNQPKGRCCHRQDRREKQRKTLTLLAMLILLSS